MCYSPSLGVSRPSNIRTSSEIPRCLLCEFSVQYRAVSGLRRFAGLLSSRIRRQTAKHALSSTQPVVLSRARLRRAWLRTNGVDTNGAAAKVMNCESLEKKVCSDPIGADPFCPFPKSAGLNRHTPEWSGNARMRVMSVPNVSFGVSLPVLSPPLRFKPHLRSHCPTRNYHYTLPGRGTRSA